VGLFTKLDQIVIGVLHDVQHVRQGEAPTIVFEKLNPSTNAVIDLLTIDSFEYDDRTAENRALPPEVQYELRISEAILEPGDYNGIASIRHETPQGITRYSIIRPSPFWPSGFNRFWRFWLTASEIIPTPATQFWLGTHENEIFITQYGQGIATQV